MNYLCFIYKGDSLTVDTSVGNGNVSAEVSEITSGGVSDVFVDSSGTGYKVGDAIKFTAVPQFTLRLTLCVYIRYFEGILQNLFCIIEVN